ncbi:type II toxin-antitoxin system VapC family toxin [Bdellovibrionota bacterium FG-2]
MKRPGSNRGHYLDSSVVLAALLGEKDTESLRLLDTHAYCSEITLVEVARTLERARLTQRLSDAEFSLKTKESVDLLATFNLVPVSSEIIQLAKSAYPIAVRALDAVHVATAEWLRTALAEKIIFWTYDHRQAEAAQSRGLDIRQ